MKQCVGLLSKTLFNPKSQGLRSSQMIRSNSLCSPRTEGVDQVVPDPWGSLPLVDQVRGLVDGPDVLGVAALLGSQAPAHRGLADDVQGTVGHLGHGGAGGQVSSWILEQWGK